MVQQDPSQAARLYTRLERGAVFLTSIIVAVTLIAFVLAPFLAWQWTRLPFPGFMLEPTLHVSGTFSPDWEGPHYGLINLDRLLAVDGQPIRSTTGLNDALRAYPVGQRLVFDFLDYDSQQVVHIPLTLVPFSSQDLAWFFIVPYLVGLSYLAIGVWVFRLRYRQAAGRVFALMCCGIALMTGLFFDLYTTHRLGLLWAAGIPLGAGGLLALSVLFPQEQRLVARWPWLAWLPFIPSTALIVYDWLTTYDLAHSLNYVWAWRLGYFYGGIGLLALIGMTAYRRYFSPSPIIRRQSNIILWGTFVPFSPILYFVLRSALGLPTNVVPWIYLAPLVLFPLAIAYSILRYRVFDVDLVVSRGLSYAVLTAIIVGVYFLMINAVSFALRSSVPADNPWLIAALILAVAALLDPVRDRVQRAVDSLFGLGGVDYRASLQTFSERLTELVDVDRILESLCDQVTRSVQPGSMWVYLYDAKAGGYMLHALPGMTRPPPGAVRFPADCPLAGALADSRAPLYIEPGRPLSPSLAGDQERFQSLGASLFVPLRGGRQSGGRRLAGWIAQTDKQSGRTYTNDDLDFLLALADQTTLALDKARIFVDLNRRVEELGILSIISQAVTFALAIDDIFELIYTQIGRVIDTSDCFYIALYDARRQALRFAFYVEKGERMYLDEEWPLDVGLTSDVVRSGRPVVTGDYLSECERRGMTPSVTAGSTPPRAWLGVPLMAGDQVAGVMAVSNTDPNVSYTDDNVLFFRSVADQTSSILEKSRLYREMEQRALQLATLNEVGRTIASTLDMRTALNLIIEKAAEILDAEAASLFLIDPETDELVFEVALGPTAPNLLGTRLPKGKGIVGTVAQTLETAIVNDAASDARHYKGYDKSGEFVTQALIAVPMIAKDRAIGVIEVLNKRDGTPFDASDANLLQAFAAQSAVAIENARLYTLTDEALTMRVEELQTLQRIDRELNASLDVERALDLTVQWAMRITGATAGLLGVMTPEGDGLLLHAIHGYGDELERYRTEPWPVERGILGRVASLGFPNMVLDVSQDPDYVSLIPEIQSQLTVPVLRENRVTGVITLESTRSGDFDLEDLNFVVRLADHASIAIANSQLYEQVKRANEYKSEFVSIVAHELKLPMQNIKGYADLLSKGLGGELNDTQNQFLGVIRSNVDRMNTLVNDLLEISRIETGRLRLELKPTSIQDVVQDVVRSLGQRLEEKRQTIEVDVPPVLPLVMGDKSRLNQIVTNMLSNANKYTPEGGHIQVRVWQQERDGQLEIVCAVKDDGIGISPEDVARLGEKFFRASDQRVRDIHGHGLGLSIVKNLIQMHGGQLMIESQVGQGSTFSFNVPVATNVQAGPA